MISLDELKNLNLQGVLGFDQLHWNLPGLVLLDTGLLGLSARLL
jgi:hypothetical protein